MSAFEDVTVELTPEGVAYAEAARIGRIWEAELRAALRTLIHTLLATPPSGAKGPAPGNAGMFCEGKIGRQRRFLVDNNGVVRIETF